jgi:outer membrane scaffolding protein for murein synthesis (MipA/OmpV family)
MIFRLTTASRRTATTIALLSGLTSVTVASHTAFALTAEDNLSWAGKVKGVSVAPVSFPGSESYSFVTSPAVTRYFSGVPSTGNDQSESALTIGLTPGRPGMGMDTELNLTPLSGVSTRSSVAQNGIKAEYYAGPVNIRLRAEGKMGLLGSSGFGGVFGADYVHRLSDAVVIAGGPRLAVTGNDYASNVYGITLTDPIRLNQALSGRPDTMRFVGAGASLNLNSSPSTSASFYATYDRMMLNTNEASTSKTLPAQNQFSFGAQFNYHFGGR